MGRERRGAGDRRVRHACQRGGPRTDELALSVYGGEDMRRTLLTLAIIVVTVGGMSPAHHDEHGKGGAGVKVLSQKQIAENLDGKESKVTMVEVTLAPGEVAAAHRHSGPAFS